MGYIGTPIDTRNQFQSLQGKRFNGDGSTTDFTLDVAPGATLDIEVFVGNVRQDPNSAYTLSGTTLSFTGAPPSGTNNIYVVHQAKSVGTIGIPDDTISARTLVTADSSADHVIIEDATDGELKKALYPSGFSVSSITGATALDDVPDTTDEFIFSDGGTLKRIDANFIMNTPSFFAYKTADTSVADSTDTVLIPTSIVQNDGTAYDSSNGRFTVPSGQDGLYFIYGHYRINNFDPNRCNCHFAVNGSEQNWTLTEHAPEGSLSGRRPTIHATAIMTLAATDYVQVRAIQTSGSTDNVFNTVFGGFKIR